MGEREFADLLKAHGWPNARRGQQRSGVDRAVIARFVGEQNSREIGTNSTSDGVADLNQAVASRWRLEPIGRGAGAGGPTPDVAVA